MNAVRQHSERKHVRAEAAGELVNACAAIQRIAAAIAEQLVAAAQAEDEIVALAAAQCVVASGAGERLPDGHQADEIAVAQRDVIAREIESVAGAVEISHIGVVVIRVKRHAKLAGVWSGGGHAGEAQTGEVDLVNTGCEIRDAIHLSGGMHTVRQRAEFEHINAQPARQLVNARAAIQRIIAVFAVQNIRAGATLQPAQRMRLRCQ